MHRRNEDERAIGTFNNHLVAGLWSVNKYLPLQLWDMLLEQATTTLNLMCKSRINPNISSHEQIFVIFNFNCTSFAPLGTRILVHDKPEKRAKYSLTIHMDGTLADQRYTTYASNGTWQAPNPRELQTQLNYYLTILTCPKPPKKIHNKLQHHNLSVT